MSRRIANIILLVEDLNQENLLRRYLRRLGQENRNIRVRRLQVGRGSGEQFVREGYASEVRAIRSQMTRTSACLIAMIDADLHSCEERVEAFARALRDAEEDARMPTDPILHLVPKRNVETWILSLNLDVVDELTDYRRDPRIAAETIKQAGERLFEWTRPHCSVPSACVPSLRACLPEFDRLPRP